MPLACCLVIQFELIADGFVPSSSQPCPQPLTLLCAPLGPTSHGAARSLENAHMLYAVSARSVVPGDAYKRGVRRRARR